MHCSVQLGSVPAGHGRGAWSVDTLAICMFSAHDCSVTSARPRVGQEHFTQAINPFVNDFTLIMFYVINRAATEAGVGCAGGSTASAQTGQGKLLSHHIRTVRNTFGQFSASLARHGIRGPGDVISVAQLIQAGLSQGQAMTLLLEFGIN